MTICRYRQTLATFSLAMLMAANASAASTQQPSTELLQKVAKIDACAMALDQVDQKLSQALQIKAEILMNPYYTDELDAMPDSEYNQIPWVKTYNDLYLTEQNAFHQHGTPEFSKEAVQQKYQGDCVKLATKELNADTAMTKE